MERETKFVRTNHRRSSRRSGRRQQRRQQLRNRPKNERQKGGKMSNVNNKRRRKKGQICAILLKIVLADAGTHTRTHTNIPSSWALAVSSSLFIQFFFFLLHLFISFHYYYYYYVFFFFIAFEAFHVLSMSVSEYEFVGNLVNSIYISLLTSTFDS